MLCKHVFHILKTFNMAWHDLSEEFRFELAHGKMFFYLCMCFCVCVCVCVCVCSQIIDSCRTNPLFTCDEETLRHHDRTYSSVGDVKDVDPEVLKGVFNFIETNTQVPENVDVSEDVKEHFHRSPTRTNETDTIDELGTLRELSKVSFGIREQCKLITDLTYKMDDVACGQTVLEHLTDLYTKMYDACRKDSLVVPLRKDHLKFTVLGGHRKKKSFY